MPLAACLATCNPVAAVLAHIGRELGADGSTLAEAWTSDCYAGWGAACPLARAAEGNWFDVGDASKPAHGRLRAQGPKSLWERLKALGPARLSGWADICFARYGCCHSSSLDCIGVGGVAASTGSATSSYGICRTSAPHDRRTPSP